MRLNRDGTPAVLYGVSLSDSRWLRVRYDGGRYDGKSEKEMWIAKFYTYDAVSGCPDYSPRIKTHALPTVNRLVMSTGENEPVRYGLFGGMTIKSVRFCHARCKKSDVSRGVLLCAFVETRLVVMKHEIVGINWTLNDEVELLDSYESMEIIENKTNGSNLDHIVLCSSSSRLLLLIVDSRGMIQPLAHLALPISSNPSTVSPPLAMLWSD